MSIKVTYQHESGKCTVLVNGRGQIQGCTNNKTGSPVNLTTHERQSIIASLGDISKSKPKAKRKAKSKAAPKRKAKAKAR